MNFLSGHIIKFNKTNLSVTEPHRIIVSNSNQVLVALLYDDSGKIYLPNNNAIISFTKFINILNDMLDFFLIVDNSFKSTLNKDTENDIKKYQQLYNQN